MIRIRRFEEQCAELYAPARSAASCTSTSARRRSRSACIARARADGRGRRPRIASTATRSLAASRCAAIMAEMYGKREGCCRGRGGSMHLFDASTASTAATRSSAAGCRSRSGSRSPTSCAATGAVTACFFGDGAVAEGEFHESLNLAALWKLPVLFVCENNLYAMGTALERARVRDAHRCARPASLQRCRRRRVDGMDVLAVSRRPRAGAASAIRARPPARGSSSCLTYRFRAHSMFDPELYRDKAEVEALEASAIRSRRFSDAAARPKRCSPTPTSRRSRRGRARRSRTPCAFAEAARLEPVDDLADATSTRAGQRVSATRRTTYREAAARGAARRAARRPARVPDRRGRRPVRRLLRRDARACSRSSARSACATRRSRSRRSSARASARRSTVCGRSSRS